MTERGNEHSARPAGAFDPAASAGLFVGVQTFEDQIAAVPYAVDDAVDLAHLFVVELGLIAPRSAVLLLAGEPRKSESAQRLAALLAAGARRQDARQREVYRLVAEQAQVAGPRGLFVLTVATHGLSDQGGDFFLATDSLLARTLRTGVSVNEVFDDVSKAHSGRALVLLDTCRERLTEETRGTRGLGLAESFEKAMASAQGVVVLSGTTVGGFSYDDPSRENGVFTAAVLDGLKGQAPAGADGWITVRTLADFVNERVAAWVRKYRPADVGRSKGIGRNVDGFAEGIPLAPHTKTLAAREEFRKRKAAALRHLAQVVSGSELLDGGHLDFVKKRLAGDEGGAEAERILRAIEALDEGEGSQRSFRDLIWELGGGRDAALNPEPKPAVPMRFAGSSSEYRKDREAKSWLRFLDLLAAGSLGLGFMAVIWLLWIVFDVNKKEPAEDAAVKPIPGASATGVKTEPGRDASEVEATAEEPAAGTLLAGPLGMRFRWVPSGTYKIGSPKGEPGRDVDETQRNVTISEGFWLGETEVTQAQWRQLVPETSPWKFKQCGANCPVESVNWYEAVEFANRLSARENLSPCYRLEGPTGKIGEGLTFTTAEIIRPCDGYRLPSEEEWEVAARAGTSGATYSENLASIAWFVANSTNVTHPVGQKLKNDWGFFDMLGNVWEWTDSDSEGRNRVVRGGSWLSIARFVRAAYRVGHHPSDRWFDLGIRLARGQGSAQ